ncbi:hypothetical protein DPMN_149225 [Dreissena polymorpha]|uniref:Uncharacterized protein n=1 Tax=Dreissena polymorpha TaxID=45954 RepID=A0A9D4FAZ8_DREPO|nr:hypothetical protein DPMN_149225 [Dreissena polymorpha]
MSIRSPQDCFTITSIIYSTDTRPLAERFSIHFLLDRYLIFLTCQKISGRSPTNADLPDRPLSLMPTEKDQYPTAWSGLIELI